MKYLFNEYGQGLFSLIVGVSIITLFLGVVLVDVLSINVKALENGTNKELFIEESVPTKIDSFICCDAVVKKGENFDYTKYVEATNSKGENISSFISLYEDVDTNYLKETEAIYILRYNGEKMIGKAKVIIENEEYD